MNGTKVKLPPAESMKGGELILWCLMIRKRGAMWSIFKSLIIFLMVKLHSIANLQGVKMIRVYLVTKWHCTKWSSEGSSQRKPFFILVKETVTLALLIKVSPSESVLTFKKMVTKEKGIWKSINCMAEVDILSQEGILWQDCFFMICRRMSFKKQIPLERSWKKVTITGLNF